MRGLVHLLSGPRVQYSEASKTLDYPPVSLQGIEGNLLVIEVGGLVLLKGFQGELYALFFISAKAYSIGMKRHVLVQTHGEPLVCARLWVAGHAVFG